MKRFLVSGAVALTAAVGCSAAGPPADTTAQTSSAIQGGQDDPSDDFAVAVFLDLGGNAGDLCSGVLLAPNLVATARHCVQQPSSDAVDCSSTTFESLYSASQLVVTNDAVFDTGSTVHEVSQVIVPSDPSEDALCGDDIALLVLKDNITIAQYVEPVIVPAMTDHSVWATTVAAIGYGVDSPTDTTGSSAGTRRIKQDISLVCIPNDSSFTNCYSDPSAKSLVAADEFESGDGTCEGDSGSGAFDQTQYSAGKWVAFGVLSRGGQSNDQTSCVGSVYSRFDAWGGLLVSAAQQAAQAGNYALPAWATPEAAASDWGADGLGASGGSSGSGSGGSKGGCAMGGSKDPTHPVPWRVAPWAVAALAVAARRARGGRRRR
jgi:Trypsin